MYKLRFTTHSIAGVCRAVIQKLAYVLYIRLLVPGEQIAMITVFHPPGRIFHSGFLVETNSVGNVNDIVELSVYVVNWALHIIHLRGVKGKNTPQ